jgi:hypothetical protein
LVGIRVAVHGVHPTGCRHIPGLAQIRDTGARPASPRAHA